MDQTNAGVARSNSLIPVIDISPYFAGAQETKQRVAEQIGRACREVGFYVVVGHKVDPKLVDEVEAVSREFFDLPVDDKMKVHIEATGGVGYSAIGEIALAHTRGQITPHDLNETFQIAKVDIANDAYFQSEAARGMVPTNRWPEQPAALKNLYSKYYSRMGTLATSLMRLSALALGLPENYFDDKIDRHISRLNVRLYPEQKAAPLPGQLRAGAHTDYGTVTILKPGDTVGGLQIADANGNWHDVPMIADSFVINLGDLMARWTNDRWLSTLHRVANPPEEAKGGSRRLSIVFFHHPNYDATISCLPTCVEAGCAPRYESITVSDYYRMKKSQQRITKEKTPESSAA